MPPESEILNQQIKQVQDIMHRELYNLQNVHPEYSQMTQKDVC